MSEHIAGVNPKIYNGKEYRSTLEAETAETLDKMGIPWEYETKTYTLQESFYCQWQKRIVMPIQYIPDFIIGPIQIEMKGYETPDWKIKKKLFFKYLKENEPDTIWYMCKNNKQLLEALDNHWAYLGFCVEAASKPDKKHNSETYKFDSIKQAMLDLGLKGKSMTSVLRSLTGRTEYVYGYKWNLKKIIL